MEIKKTNCPNCGAPIKGGRCEYCGTKFVQELEGEDLAKFLNGDFKKMKKN